ncbi:MAG: hypothetical protein EHM12_06685 [Dehalococcoidia bacterium]|nr:MAG: hypothetical protein EHM12_06685 [Dehalococcoidia bacterium]
MDKRQLRAALAAYINDRGEKRQKQLYEQVLTALMRDDRFKSHVLEPAEIIKKHLPDAPLGEVSIGLPVTIRTKVLGKPLRDERRFFPVPGLPNMSITLEALDIGIDSLSAIRRYFQARDGMITNLNRLYDELAPYAGKHRELIVQFPALAPYIEQELPQPISEKKTATRKLVQAVLQAPMAQLLKES